MRQSRRRWWYIPDILKKTIQTQKKKDCMRRTRPHHISAADISAITLKFSCATCWHFLCISPVLQASEHFYQTNVFISRVFALFLFFWTETREKPSGVRLFVCEYTEHVLFIVIYLYLYISCRDNCWCEAFTQYLILCLQIITYLIFTFSKH